MHPTDPLTDRKRRARKIGIITGVAAFVLILGGATVGLSLGYGEPLGGGDDYQRGQALGIGAMMLSFWCGVIAWGGARIVLHIKAQRPNV